MWTFIWVSFKQVLVTAVTFMGLSLNLGKLLNRNTVRYALDFLEVYKHVIYCPSVHPFFFTIVVLQNMVLELICFVQICTTHPQQLDLRLELTLREESWVKCCLKLRRVRFYQPVYKI
jgi:ABC-type sugar transport system permease subunit